MESSINQVLQNYNKSKKLPTKPPNNRQKYYQLYEWSRSSLERIELEMQKIQQGASSTEFLAEQKKILISMLLQMSRLMKQQCVQKGKIVQQMFQLALKFVNQHQKSYDMLTYRQVKNFRDSTAQMQKQYQQINQQLRNQIKVLIRDKEHRWRNLFMLIKDNRIFRRRNSKLLKAHRQLTWKIKQLQQDLISIRLQNQKYRLQSQQISFKQSNLKSYVSNQILLNKLDERVKLYPGRAKRLLKKQLLDSDINELNTLGDKINFIIQSMQQNGQVCQQFDSWDDNIQSTRLFYNVSIQTYIETQSIGINTIQPIIPKKLYQSTRVQTRPKDFVYLQLISKTIEVKLGSNVKKFGQRKKTQQKLINLSNSRFKRHATNSNNEPLNQSELKIYKFKIQNTVNIQFKSTKVLTNKKYNYLTINNSSNLQQNLDDSKIEEIKDKKTQNYMLKREENKYSTNKLRISTIMYTDRKKQNLIQKIQKIKQNNKIIKIDEQKENKDQNDLNLFNFTSSQNEVLLPEAKVLTYKSKIYQLHYKPENKGVFLIQNLNNHYNARQFQFDNQRLQKKKQDSINKIKVRHNSQIISKVMPILQKRFNKVTKIQCQIDNKPIIEVDERNFTKITQNAQKIKTNQQQININKKQIRHRRQNTQNLQLRRKKIYQKDFKKRQKGMSPFISSHQSQGKQKSKVFEANKDKRIKLLPREIIPLSQKQSEQKNIEKINKPFIQIKTPEIKSIVDGRKVLQKVLAAIFNKRKQIIAFPQTMRSFLQNTLLALLRNDQVNYRKGVNNSHNKLLNRFFTSIRQINIKKEVNLITHTILLFQKLISDKNCQLFSCDMFVLFAIMLQKLAILGALVSFSHIYYIQAQYGVKVIQYLCSIYLSHDQTEKFMSSKIKIQQNKINMIDAFIKVVNQLQKIIFQSELWQIFSNLPSYQNQCLTENDIFQISSLFNFVSISGWSHKQKLHFYIGGGMPLHRLCLYAHRFQWKQLLGIKSWLNERYVQQWGIFWHDQKQLPILCLKMQQKMRKKQQKYKFLYRILRRMQFKYREYSIIPNESYIKLCNLLLAYDEVQTIKIFSSRLSDIQESYRSLITKRKQQIC